MPPLTKEEVEEFLRLKALVDARADEICKEHFLKTNYIVNSSSSRFYRPRKFEGVSDISTNYAGDLVIQYNWYWFDTEWDSVSIEYLWKETDFKDHVAEINATIEKENKEFLLKQKEAQELKEAQEYQRLKEKFFKD